MEATINILELASELAHKELVENWSNSIKIYVSDDASVLSYTEEAQDLFNELYDKYYSFIEEFKC